MTAQQEKPMTISQHPGTPASRSTGGTLRRRPRRRRGFRIRCGRLALALPVLSLLTGVVSAALRLFGIGSGWLPVAALVGAAGCCGVAPPARCPRPPAQDGCRLPGGHERSPDRSSRRGRHRADDPTRRPARMSLPAARPESPLFDAESGARYQAPPAPQPLTALELREAALAEAGASGDASSARAAERRHPRRAQLGACGRPQAHLRRSAEGRTRGPEPLDLPEAPKAVGKPSLKQASRGRQRPIPQAADDAEAKAAQQGPERLEQPG